jgi:hypothetical protein
MKRVKESQAGSLNSIFRARRELLATVKARISAAATTSSLENISFRWCLTSDSLAEKWA